MLDYNLTWVNFGPDLAHVYIRVRPRFVYVQFILNIVSLEALDLHIIK